LPDKKLTRARTVSQALFGAQHRLPAALVVAAAEDGVIYAAVVANLASMTDAQAGTELEALRKAGLVEKRPPPARKAGQLGRTPKLYRRRDSKFWELAQALATKPLPKSAE
jgi:predicted ArsR family transcriptional regulator